MSMEVDGGVNEVGDLVEVTGLVREKVLMMGKMLELIDRNPQPEHFRFPFFFFFDGVGVCVSWGEGMSFFLLFFLVSYDLFSLCSSSEVVHEVVFGGLLGFFFFFFFLWGLFGFFFFGLWF